MMKEIKGFVMRLCCGLLLFPAIFYSVVTKRRDEEDLHDL